jgi:hypothetical protein
MPLLTDPIAKEIALRRWVLPECLHVPIAAVDENAIQNYIGEIQEVLAIGSPAKALLVNVREPPAIDNAYPIWDLPASEIFHRRQQVWVHIDYNQYRKAYRKAFPDELIDGKVLSHTMNRRTAALKGFSYVRITPTSRANNSSSAFSENWAVALHTQPPPVVPKPQAFIQYGDLTDLMLMLDMRLGGGVMELVNEGQQLIRRRS